MHVPEEFRGREVSAHTAIDEIVFATLFTGAPGADASHLPLLLDRESGPLGTLVGHVAKRNPQWRRLQPETEVLAVFLSTTAYVSPAWYASRPRVPTWNYVAVHAHCRPTLVLEHAMLRNSVLMLTQRMERPDSGWRPDAAYVDGLLDGIVGLELQITRLSAQFRLSQQNDATDRSAVHAALAAGAPGERLVAGLMERYGAGAASHG